MTLRTHMSSSSIVTIDELGHLYLAAEREVTGRGREMSEDGRHGEGRPRGAVAA
jgi:hypothetical protein